MSGVPTRAFGSSSYQLWVAGSYIRLKDVPSSKATPKLLPSTVSPAAGTTETGLTAVIPETSNTLIRRP
jgi:hypothetical protein